MTDPKPFVIPPDLPADVMQYERGWNACLEALAASHREPSAQPADKPAGEAVSRSDAAQATDAWPNGEYRLWDSQWMNVVNFDRGYESFDKEDAVNHAVKLTEKYMRENIQRAALSEAKRSHVSGDTHAPEPATAGADALRWIMRFADKCKKPCGDDPESPTAIRNAHFATIGAAAAQGLGLVRGPSLAVPAAAVPDGMVLVPSKIRVPTQAWDDAQCAFGGPDESFMDCTLWVGEIEHDDGKTKTCGLHVSNDDYPEEGSITLAEFTAAPANRPADEPLIGMTGNTFSLVPADAQRGVPDGIERAARWVEARLDDYCQEHGRQCPETGALEFGRGKHAELKEEYVAELTEIADGIRKLAASPADISQPQVAHPLSSLIDAARAMGETGAPPNEAERLAFEAWMQGHCWALCATWRGTEYRSDVEDASRYCPHARRTRELWAAWRDRAALIATPASEVSP